MKKMISLICILTILSVSVFSVYAGTANFIHFDKECIFAKKGETVTVPLVIDNNEGFMGMRLSVNYPRSVMTIISAERGEVLNTGFFNEDVSKEAYGRNDYVWSGVDNNSGNGVLIVISFRINENAEPGSYDITLSYSQDDTFNEKWKDIVFSFEDLNMVVYENNPEISVSSLYIERIIILLKRIIESIMSFIEIQVSVV